MKSSMRRDCLPLACPDGWLLKLLLDSCCPIIFIIKLKVMQCNESWGFGVNLAQPLHWVRFLFHEKSGKCCWCHGAILHPTSEPYSFSRSFHAKCHQRHHITFCFVGYIMQNSFPSGSWMENGLGREMKEGKGALFSRKLSALFPRVTPEWNATSPPPPRAHPPHFEFVENRSGEKRNRTLSLSQVSTPWKDGSKSYS